MICPNCKAEMVEKDFGGVKVDICENGCHGIWFDNFEIEKLDEHSEGKGEELKKILEQSTKPVPRQRKLECPYCNIKMAEHRYRMGQIYIDECYGCGGIFLDAGELKEIRDQFKSDGELKEKVGEILSANSNYTDKSVSSKRPAKTLSMAEKLLKLIGYMD